MKTKEKDLTTAEIVKETALKHIAIIMDGNRRWAKEKNLPSAMGHKKGVDALKATLRACKDFGIKYLTVYAFSTENWNRKKEEVDFLMELLAITLTNELAEMHSEGVVISFIGDISKLSDKLQKILANSVETTKNNTGVHLQIAFNYGSRDEIVHAVKNIVAQGIKPEDITEDLISENLYTKNIPDPDLLIRTGGEMRISNYLLWQIAYSEIYITKQYWPEFDKASLALAIEEFHNRQRRFGKYILRWLAIQKGRLQVILNKAKLFNLLSQNFYKARKGYKCMTQTIVFATGNAHKLQEIQDIAKDTGIKFVLPPDNFNPIENGKTFEENSFIKAKEAAKVSGEISLADDSGLCVEALDGAPGIYSARYETTPQKRIDKLLNELKNEKNRNAKFVCAMTLVDSEGKILFQTRGECFGKIAEKQSGQNGFGYDPVFLTKDTEYKQTMAEMTEDEKNEISHRSRALRKVLEFLNTNPTN